MKSKLCLIIFILISAACYQLLRDLPAVPELQMKEASEESTKKRAWIRAMLADPQTNEIPPGVRLQELAFLKDFQNDYRANYKNKRSVQWRNRGPWNVGGRTRGMAIDVNNESHLIAGAVSGGIWQSFDAGSSWTKVSDSNAHPGVVSISQDPRPGKSHIWYALSGELYGTSASGGSAFYLGDGAFRSFDNGNTWKPIASTADGVPGSFSKSYQGGWRMVASPVDTVAACVYMATYGSIYRSTDTGNTWKVVLGPGNNSYFTDVALTSTGMVYAVLSSDGGNTKGFFRSSDGVNFTNISPSFLKSHNRTVIGINPNNENEVYFLSELPSDTSGGVTTQNYEGVKEYVSLIKYKYLSGDGSGSNGQWTNLSGNLPVNSENAFDRFNCQSGYDLFVQAQPGTNQVFIGGTNIYRSTDGFTTPNNTLQMGGYGIGTQLNGFTMYPNHHPDQHELIFLKSDPKKAYSISDGGVKFTHDINAASVEWVDKSLGYVTSQLYTVNIDETKPFDQWVLGGFQDNGNFISYSNNERAMWNLTINGDGAYNYIAPDRAFYIISTQLGNVRKVLLDERGRVIRRKRIDPYGYDKTNYNFINPLLVDPKDHNTLYMPIGKKMARLDDIQKLEVEHNTDKLQSGWTILPDTINTLNAGTLVPEITAIGISKTQPDILYVGTNNKEIFRIMNPRSPNPIMVKCAVNRLPPAGSYVSDIAVDPDSAKNILVCYSNYGINSLYYSSDTGNTWYLVGGNLESGSNSSGTQPSVRCVEIHVDAAGNRHYFAGTSIGLFSTNQLVMGISNASNKTVWQQEDVEGIGAAVVTDIKVRRSDGYVVVATHGNGIFDSYYFGGSMVPAPNDLGNTLEVYPNPATQVLNYSFSMAEAGNVRADIVDMSGRKVMTALDEYFSKGDFTIPVRIHNLSNGHYFISHYTSGKKPMVKHFVVLKP